MENIENPAQPRRMKPEIKKLWVEALTSGKYKQGRFGLRDPENEFCCLGVLCDLHFSVEGNGVDGWGEVLGGEIGYLGAYCFPSPEVKEWAGLPEYNPEVGEDSVAALNDTGKSFEEIAKLIEEYL